MNLYSKCDGILLQEMYGACDKNYLMALNSKQHSPQLLQALYQKCNDGVTTDQCNSGANWVKASAAIALGAFVVL